MGVSEIKSKTEFDTLIASGKVIFVDFYADWCGPCKAISPGFKKLAEEYGTENVEFYKVNIDQFQELADALQIRSIPVFHAYKDGQKLDTVVGANVGALTALVKDHAAL